MTPDSEFLTKEFLVKKLIGERQSLAGLAVEIGFSKFIIVNRCKKYEIYKEVKEASKFRAKRIEDLSGQIFGSLRVLHMGSKDRFGKTRWICKCEICGNEKLVNAASLIRGLSKTCGKCQRQNFKGYKDISGAWWRKCKRQAHTRGLDFFITQEYVWEIFLKQDRKCAISGTEINFHKNNDDCALQNASIDRIDNTKGYIEENIQIVNKRVNFLRGSLEIDELLLLCREIYLNNKEKCDNLNIQLQDIKGGAFK